MSASPDFLLAAERYCDQRGARLTSQRRQVLELALARPGLVKAYDLLADMQRERGAVAPPTVYRALDFLVEQGLLHRIDALNGFVVCHHFDCPHESLLLVCERCGGVAEIDADPALAALREAAMSRGFTARCKDVVLTGTCRECVA